MSLFSKFLRSLGLTVQPIDYNSSILAALLSGINLACLELRKKQDGGLSRQSCFCRLVVFGAGSFFLFKAQKRHFQQKLAVELPLGTVSPRPGQTARLAAVTKSVPRTWINKSNRVFRWSILRREPQPPPSSSLWSIDMDRADVRLEHAQWRSARRCRTDNDRLVAAIVTEK